MVISILALAFETYQTDEEGKGLEPVIVLTKTGEQYDDLLNDILHYYLRNEYDAYNQCYAILESIKTAEAVGGLYRCYNKSFSELARWLVLPNTCPEPVRARYLISPRGFALNREYLEKVNTSSLYDKIREIINNPVIVDQPSFKETKFFNDFRFFSEDKAIKKD